MSIVETMGATLAEAYGPDVEFGDMARAALRAIKPSDISDGMVEAYLRAHGGSDESVKKALFMGVNDFRRAIAAAIAAGAEQ